jgi:protein-tyrosine-phosphatase
MAEPDAVLFVCTLNAVRSPMAKGLLRQLRPGLLVKSAGLDPGEPDHMMAAVMAELGLDLSHHSPHRLDGFKPGQFGLVISLSPEAHHHALEWTRSSRTPVEYWAFPDVTAVEGNREQRLAAYRALRDEIHKRLQARFQLAPA